MESRESIPALESKEPTKQKSSQIPIQGTLMQSNKPNNLSENSPSSLENKQMNYQDIDIDELLKSAPLNSNNPFLPEFSANETPIQGNKITKTEAIKMFEKDKSRDIAPPILNLDIQLC